ncbi:TatD family hydrolase [Bacteroidales bacterium OttesenSCG-928-A17]|nr:TatD family hydrolase [Bacteroidales bacterium OttesenSCG-928-A17]
MFWDIHTHIRKKNTVEECSILNLNIPDHLCRCGLDLQNSFYSLGIHPWKIYPELLPEHLRFIEENIQFDAVRAVGECGLDKLCNTPWELQLKAFEGQIFISEKWGKPLIFHCVKAFDELLEIKKEMKPKQAWIIHGFRGKPEQMKQLTGHGIFLSFGVRFNEDTIREMPLDRLFLETDEAEVPIRAVYEDVVRVLGSGMESLERQIEKNMSHL